MDEPTPTDSVRFEIDLPTADDTDAFGRALGRLLRAGDVLILSGSLGAGKTALTKGIGQGMGVVGTVMSPSFVLARVHRPGSEGRPALVHVDAYRLAGGVELDDLDLDTDLPTAAVVIEWGEGVAERLSHERLLIELTRRPDDTRHAALTGLNGDWAERLAVLAGLDQV